MLQNGESSVLSDNNIHEIENNDLYEGLAPHVDTTQITVSAPTSPTGEFFLFNISLKNISIFDILEEMLSFKSMSKIRLLTFF